jgi:short-subunit dehydrogenase
VVVITGASSGMGRELAMRYAKRGCKMVIAARKLPEL